MSFITQVQLKNYSGLITREEKHFNIKNIVMINVKVSIIMILKRI